MQDLGIRVAVPVIEDVDVPIRRLETVGIGHGGAIINEQAFAPGLAVVIREEGLQIRAVRQAHVERTVFDEDKFDGGQAADEKAGADVLNRAGLRLAPHRAFVVGSALADAILRAGKHPQAAVLTLDDHVLVEVGAREGHAAATCPRFALIGAGEHVGHADHVEILVRLLVHARATHAVAGPERDGQQPVAVAEHRGLVQRAAVGETHRRGPFRLGGIGIIAADVPVAAAPVEVAEALIKEAPQAAERIGPQIADESAALVAHAVEFAVLRVDDDTRLRP